LRDWTWSDWDGVGGRGMLQGMARGLRWFCFLMICFTLFLTWIVKRVFLSWVMSLLLKNVLYLLWVEEETGNTMRWRPSDMLDKTSEWGPQQEIELYISRKGLREGEWNGGKKLMRSRPGNEWTFCESCVDLTKDSSSKERRWFCSQNFLSVDNPFPYILSSLSSCIFLLSRVPSCEPGLWCLTDASQRFWMEAIQGWMDEEREMMVKMIQLRFRDRSNDA
jgi:hypothetical protein